MFLSNVYQLFYLHVYTYITYVPGIHRDQKEGVQYPSTRVI